MFVHYKRVGRVGQVYPNYTNKVLETILGETPKATIHNLHNESTSYLAKSTQLENQSHGHRNETHSMV